MILNKRARALHHKTSRIPRAPRKPFSVPPKVVLARSIVREVVGHAPYELCAMEMIRNGQDKHVKRFLRKRLGRMKMVRRKIDKLTAEVNE